MSGYPTIDRPCPLPPRERIDVRDRCGHCRQHVHSLDHMDPDQVAQLLAQAPGPLCVRYSRRPGALSMATFSALAMGAAVLVHAGEPRTAPIDTPMDGAQSPLPIAQGVDDESWELIFVGGIERPMLFQGQDDSALPELPVEYVDEHPSR